MPVWHIMDVLHTWPDTQETAAASSRERRTLKDCPPGVYRITCQLQSPDPVQIGQTVRDFFRSQMLAVSKVLSNPKHSMTLISVGLLRISELRELCRLAPVEHLTWVTLWSKVLCERIPAPCYRQ